MTTQLRAAHRAEVERLLERSIGAGPLLERARAALEEIAGAADAEYAAYVQALGPERRRGWPGRWWSRRRGRWRRSRRTWGWARRRARQPGRRRRWPWWAPERRWRCGRRRAGRSRRRRRPGSRHGSGGWRRSSSAGCGRSWRSTGRWRPTPRPRPPLRCRPCPRPPPRRCPRRAVRTAARRPAPGACWSSPSAMSRTWTGRSPAARTSCGRSPSGCTRRGSRRRPGRWWSCCTGRAVRAARPSRCTPRGSCATSSAAPASWTYAGRPPTSRRCPRATLCCTCSIVSARPASSCCSANGPRTSSTCGASASSTRSTSPVSRSSSCSTTPPTPP